MYTEVIWFSIRVLHAFSIRGANMSKVVDAACFIIDVVNEQEMGQVSNISINKLLYIAQGLSLAKTGKPLFSNQIEAWDKGPVIQRIYHEYKKYADGPIPKQEYTLDSLNDDEQDILLETVARYGMYSASDLIKLTHAKDTPWALHYLPNVKEVPIPQDEIKNYFTKNVKLNFYDENRVTKVNVDDLGRLLLPAEIEDAWGEPDVH